LKDDISRNKRHEIIMEKLNTEGEVSVDALTKHFGVNSVTIRRDLGFLERDGLLRRTHGGAAISRSGKIEFQVKKKGRSNTAQKAAIAAAAADLVRPGMSVSLDTGTTTLEVARKIARKGELKVLTSSLLIASVLYPHDNIELVLLGGVVRKGNPDLFGTLTEDNLRRFHVDMSFLGADAAAADGLYTTDVGISRVSQAMLTNAGTSVIVLDSSKFATSAFVRFATWENVNHVITDTNIPESSRVWLEKAVDRVTYVPVENQQSGDE